MTEQNVIEKLREDEHYYGEFGKQFLSNSDISTLLTNPLALGEQSKMSSAFLVGGYFHTAILEPDKLEKYKVIEATTRNTKKYKEISEGELCLLQHEVDQIELMREKVLSNKICKEFILGSNSKSQIEYEVPGIIELEGTTWYYHNIKPDFYWRIWSNYIIHKIHERVLPVKRSRLPRTYSC